jgi:thioredoxin-related protein
MKQLLIIMFALVIAGCAGSVEVEDQIKKLTAEMKQADESIRNDYKRDLAVAQQSFQSDLNNLKKEMDTQKEVHQKDLKEVNVTLIDIQKDFFQNRRVTEDNARRVYIMESLIAATRSTPEERAEGEIVYLRELYT